jgi:hypothetical protein
MLLFQSQPIGIYFWINQSAVSQAIRRLEMKWKELPGKGEAVSMGSTVRKLINDD